MISKEQFLNFWRFFGFGFSGGIPYFWIAMTLPLCIADQTRLSTHFKLLSVLFLPYTLKPLLAAILSYFSSLSLSFNALFLKSIVIFSQIVIVFSLYRIGYSMTPIHFEPLWKWSFIIACAGSVQDIVLEAYRIRLSHHQSTVSHYVFGTQTGFRMAGLVVSSGMLWCAHYWSWTMAIKSAMVIMILNALVTMMTMRAHRIIPPAYEHSLSYWYHLKREIKDIFSWNSLPIWMFVHLFAYKIIDCFIRWIWPIFFFQQGYSKLELMYADKGLGWCSVILGGAMAQKLLKHYTLRWTIFTWGAFQTLAYLTCFAQLYMGKNIMLLFLSSFVHQTLSGAGNLLIWVYISQYCYTGNTMMRYSIVSACFSLDRLCVLWCASLLYHQVPEWIFFSVGICFSAGATVFLWYPKKVKAISTAS